MKIGNTFIKAAALLCLLTLLSAAFFGCRSGGKQIDFARINDDGELVLYYTNGEEENLGRVNGEDGTAGEQGKDGSAGPKGSDGEDGSLIIENDDREMAHAVSKGLQSAVSINCNFTVRTGYFSTSTATSAGSGVIYKLDKARGEAYIITNYHVVYESSSTTSNKISDDITVYLYGSEYDSQGITATYVGGSMNYDIAVLRVSDPSAFSTSDATEVTVSDSEQVYVGDVAIAIGNPEGMGISASSGVINVDSEYITMTAPDNTTQVTFRVRVDTAINSGNSGGGLYNASGELIGIVNAKVSTTDVENIGYAIPSNLATAVADNIIDHSTLREIALGFTPSITDSHAEYDTSTGLISIVEKVQVSSISSNGLFANFVAVGDTVVSVSVDDKTIEITRIHQLTELMLELRSGDIVTLKYLRNGSEQTAVATVT